MKESEFTEKFNKFLREAHDRMFMIFPDPEEGGIYDSEYKFDKCFYFKFGSKHASHQTERAHVILREAIAIAFDIKLEEG